MIRLNPFYLFHFAFVYEFLMFMAYRRFLISLDLYPRTIDVRCVGSCHVMIIHGKRYSYQKFVRGYRSSLPWGQSGKRTPCGQLSLSLSLSFPPSFPFPCRA